VPGNCYDDVLVIEEFERNKPGIFQLKYYAPGVGEVRAGWRRPGRTRSQMEKHAYEIKYFYLKTQPAKPTL
jgi:hypothetical protein